MSTEMDALNSEYFSTAVLGDDIPSYAQSGIMWSVQSQGADKALIFANEHNLAIYTLTKTDSGFKARYSRAFKQYLATE